MIDRATRALSITQETRAKSTACQWLGEICEWTFASNGFMTMISHGDKLPRYLALLLFRQSLLKTKDG
ncbi:MAG: hypothetical protein DI557_22275 [Serratia marcescens]|nr:MAG: hypothetical protein DI557_22275 [Serratia marcescens]